MKNIGQGSLFDERGRDGPSVRMSKLRLWAYTRFARGNGSAN